MDLVADCYRLTERFPGHETYGLAAQVRRAAVSVPANIAEGHGRDHLREYLHHLSIAHASLMELETHVLLAERIGYAGHGDVGNLLQRAAELGRMLRVLMRKLRAHTSGT